MMPLEESFGHWVSEAQQGKDGAFEKLIGLSEDRLFRFCLMLTGNRELSQELCQETYIRIFAKIKALAKGERFMEWIFRIAKNLYYDHLRELSVQMEQKQTDNIDELDLSIELVDMEKILSVRSVLKQLDEQDQLTIVLIDVEGCSYGEASEIIGISEDSLRSRLHRSRKKFAELWKKRETKLTKLTSSSLKTEK